MLSHRPRRSGTYRGPVLLENVRIVWTMGAIMYGALAILFLVLSWGHRGDFRGFMFIVFTLATLAASYAAYLAWRQSDVVIMIRSGSRWPVHRYRWSDGIFVPDPPSDQSPETLIDAPIRSHLRRLHRTYRRRQNR